jgi:hypothetical protein
VENERYIGDGVYASFDGYQIWLDTRAQEPVNRIALEPSVYAQLLRFAKDMTSKTSDDEVAEEGA